MSAKVSVVLPAYKEKFLAEAIDSILNQTFTDFELIVVNDNPGSSIMSIVKGFNDARISYFENKENIGGQDLIRHWNNCIGYANGEYLVLASDDDVYDKRYLDEMIGLTEKNPSSDLYYCRIRYIDENGATLQISQPALEFETSIDFIYQRLFWNRKQALQEFLFRTSALKSKGGFVNFPLAWYSDDATLALMSANGVCYSGKPLFGMRMSGQNISSGNLYKRKKISALKQYVRWLEAFLPTLYPVNEADSYMKERLMKEFKPILNDFRLRSVKSLGLTDAVAEYKSLIEEKIYSRLFIYRQIIKKIIGL